MGRLALAAVLLVAAVSCGDDGDSDDSSDAGAGTTAPSAPSVSLEGQVNDRGSTDLGAETTLELELDESYFAPTFVTADPGSTVTVTLTNEGDAPHTFTIDDANIDEQLDPGATATVEVELPDEGSLAFYCRFHVGAGMQGAFVVSGTTATPAAGSGGGVGY